MVVDAAIPDAGEVKLVCSLLEVMITFEVVINYANEKRNLKKKKKKSRNGQTGFSPICWENRDANGWFMLDREVMILNDNENIKYYDIFGRKTSMIEI